MLIKNIGLFIIYTIILIINHYTIFGLTKVTLLFFESILGKLLSLKTNCSFFSLFVNLISIISPAL